MTRLIEFIQVKVKVRIGHLIITEWLAKARGRITIENALDIEIKGGRF